MMDKKKLLGIIFLFFLVCNSMGAVAGTTWHSETFGGSVTVEAPPSPPGTNVSWVSRSFGCSVTVTGAYAGDWSPWWTLGFFGFAPTVDNIVPADGSTVIRGDVRLTGDFEDGDGDNMNITWYNWNNNTQIGSNNSVVNGTYSQDVFVKYQQVFNWGVNITDGNNWNNYTFMFTGEDLNPVSDFSVVNYSSTALNLSWSKNNNVSTSYVRFSTTTYPLSRSSGTFLVNTTDVMYNHTGRVPGQRYYYSIWSYNSTDNVYSNNYAMNDTYTNPGNPTSLQDTSKTMNSISLQWVKGTGATYSVVFRNESGNSSFPSRFNGTEVINNTGTSGTDTGLNFNVTYYYSVYSYNPSSDLWSLGRSTRSAATTGTAGDVSVLSVVRYNDVQLNLSWSKTVGSDNVVVVRNTSDYPSTPTDGVVVYNGSSLSFKDTGLNPASKYYYSAWTWNGEQHGGNASGYNITRPSPPVDMIGSIDGDSLIITWTKGEGAARTVIRNDSAGYPASPLLGDHVYNDTGNTVTVDGVTDIDFYRSWSYIVIDDEHIYSLPADLLWGGLEINVYNEHSPSTAVTGYTVFITNPISGATYSATNQNNPFRIDVLDVPNGEDITIQVSKTGFYPRSMVMDLYENVYYLIDFLLPPVETPGVGGDPDVNETTKLYYINVIDSIDQPIQEAYVVISKYNNHTGNYVNVFSDTTDANGQTRVYLIPHQSYRVVITKEGYETETTLITARPEDLLYTFRLILIEAPSAPALYPHEYVFLCNRSSRINDTLTVDFLNTHGNVLYAVLRITMIDSDGNSSLFYAQSFILQNSFTVVRTGLDVNSSYKVVVNYSHSVFGSQSMMCMFSSERGPHITPDSVNVIFTSIFGVHPLVWSHFLMLLLSIALFFYTDEEHMGIMLMVMGVLFIFINVYLGFDDAFLVVAGGIIPGLCILVGVLLEWVKHSKSGGG